MNEYGVILVIITLIGLIASIVTPMLKLSKVITTLTVTVDNLQKTIDKQESDNRRSHDRLWDKTREIEKKDDEQDGKLQEHEHRIKDMERRGRAKSESASQG